MCYSLDNDVLAFVTFMVISDRGELCVFVESIVFRAHNIYVVVALWRFLLLNLKHGKGLAMIGVAAI